MSIRTNQTDIEEISNNLESRQQQGIVLVQQVIQRSESLQLNMAGGDQETKGPKTIVDLLRRQPEREQQGTTTVRTQEDMDETQ